MLDIKPWTNGAGDEIKSKRGLKEERDSNQQLGTITIGLKNDTAEPQIAHPYGVHTTVANSSR